MKAATESAKTVLMTSTTPNAIHLISINTFYHAVR
jgi:hypothetical protein